MFKTSQTICDKVTELAYCFRWNFPKYASKIHQHQQQISYDPVSQNVFLHIIRIWDLRFFWLPYCMISYGWYWHAHIWCCVCYQCLKRHLSAQFLSWVEFQLKDTLSRFLVLKLMRWFLSHLCKCRQCQLKVSSIQNESMRSSFLPKCQPNILRISALPSNKLPGQKSLKCLVGILGETMTS